MIPSLRAGTASWRPRLAGCLGGLTVGVAVILWTVGRFSTPQPWWLRLILATALISSLLAIVWCRPGLRLGRLCGVASLISVALFLAILLHKPDGPVEVVRRVSLPQQPPAELRLVSFNVLHGYPESRAPERERRYELLAAALRVLDPAVVVLQEAWWLTGRTGLAARLGNELGYDVAYAAANGSRRLIGFEEGSAVLSRLPIVAARRYELEPRKAPWRVRIALITTVALATDERITVVGTHLANDAPEIAAAQSRGLAAELPDQGTVWVAGDLNAGSDSAAVRALVGEGLIDVLPGGIDHVLVSTPGSSSRTGAWVVSDARWTLRPRDLQRLLGTAEQISDHPGILVDLVRIRTQAGGARGGGQ